MAQDRISLRCTRCGAQRVLFRYAPGGIEFRSSGLEEWAQEHIIGCGDRWDQNLGDDPGVEIVTESVPAFPVSET